MRACTNAKSGARSPICLPDRPSSHVELDCEGEGAGRGCRARVQGEGAGRGCRARQPTGKEAAGQGAGRLQLGGVRGAACEHAERGGGVGQKRGGGGARLGQELEGEARLAPAVGPIHAQVAKARLALVMVAHAPALAVGHRPTGIAWRVGAVVPVRPALVRQVAHDLAAVSGHLPGAGCVCCATLECATRRLQRGYAGGTVTSS
jgi:hypothetical protein